MTEDEHQLASYLQSAVALDPYAMVTTPALYSQAATVHTYPGLPPVAELIPEAEGP